LRKGRLFSGSYVMHAHVAPNVIPRAVRPVDFERIDEQVHLLTMAGRFHRFSIVAGQVIFRRESTKTGENLCLVRVNQFGLGPGWQSHPVLLTPQCSASPWTAALLQR